MPIRYICDFCERPLKTRPVNGTDVHITYLTKEWSTKQLYSCLCESCAEKLDAAIRKVKDEAVLGGLIAARNSRLNEERKRKLGTRGGVN